MTDRKTGLLVVNGPLPPPYGGVATYLAHTLPFLAAHGFDVHTVIDRRPDDPKTYQRFEDAGVHIHYGGESRLKKTWQIMRRVPLWLRAKKKSGVDSLTLLKALKSIVSWIDASERVLRQHPIDIIHAYDYPWAQGFVASHLAGKYGKKFVQTIFGEVVPHRSEIEHHDDLGDAFKPFARFVLQQADLILSCSTHCGREVRHVGMDPESVKVTYYGIDVGRYHPQVDSSAVRSQYRLDGKRIVLFLGQVRARKGPQVLLEAAPDILNIVPNTVFLIVGPDFGMADELARRADRLGISSAFLILGAKEESELPGFFAACDVFVFPSCTPIECLGLTTVQAMACGKPAVGSNINGVPEVIVDGETGFLVDPNNPAQLAEKVSLLLRDEKLCAVLGAAARARAVERFDREKLAQALVNLYRTIT